MLMINKFGNFFLKTCHSSLDMTYWKSNNRKMFAVLRGNMLQISPEKGNVKIHQKKISPS